MEPVFRVDYDNRAFLCKYAPGLLELDGWQELGRSAFLLWVYDRDPSFAKAFIGGLVASSPRLEAEEEERRWNKEQQMIADGIILSPHLKASVPESGMTFETLLLREEFPAVQEAHRAVLQWCNEQGYTILVLAGPPGVGKTHLLSAAVHWFRERNREHLYLTDAQMATELHGAMGRNQYNEALSDITGVHRLLWDDLGMASRGDFDKAGLDQIVNERWAGASGGLRTLITTNLSEQHLSPRLASRLADTERVRVVEVKASDYRRIIRA